MVSGAIEVATTSTKAARRVVEIGRDGSDNEGDAAAAFESVQKKLRVTGSAVENEDSEMAEVALKMDDEEFHSLLWGTDKNGSDDENDNKKRKTGGHARNRRTTKPDTTTEDSSNADTSQVPHPSPWNLYGPASNKKAVAEGKELDKAESLVLTISQFKTQLQESESIAQITLTKVRSLLDKVNARLSPECTKVYVEAIRRSGSSSRASSVWQQVKDAKAELES